MTAIRLPDGSTLAGSAGVRPIMSVPQKRLATAPSPRLAVDCRWSLLPSVLLDMVLDCTCTREHFVSMERVCTAWRLVSRRGSSRAWSSIYWKSHAWLEGVGCRSANGDPCEPVEWLLRLRPPRLARVRTLCLAMPRTREAISAVSLGVGATLTQLVLGWHGAVPTSIFGALLEMQALSSLDIDVGRFMIGAGVEAGTCLYPAACVRW